jgi:hypothetical protein
MAATIGAVRRRDDGTAGCWWEARRGRRDAESVLLGCAARRDHHVLDRLISGAGALTDRADRLVRMLTSGRGPDIMGNRPGSVLVIVLLIVAAVIFGLLAIEATDNPTPRALAPADIAGADDLGGRVYATVEGVLDENYVETYPDDDFDGVQDADETGDAWFYFLVNDAGRGVTVRSERHPDDLYRYTATGVVVRDPEYVDVDVARFHDLEGTTGVELEDTFYLDATTDRVGEAVPLDLDAEMPPDGTVVSISGPYFGYLDVCSEDADGDGACEETEYDLIDAFIGDPDTGRAITVLKPDHPAPVPIAVTGMLRRETGSILDAKATQGLDFGELGITVSDRYLLVDQARPANGALSMGLAIAAGLLAAVLAVGLAGGYLVFRRSKRPLPSGGRTLEAGESISIRVTGSLRSESGLIHVREAKAVLLRYPLVMLAPAEAAAVEEPAPESEPAPGAEAGPAQAEQVDAPEVAWPSEPEPDAAPAVPGWSSLAAEVRQPSAPATTAPVLPADVPTTLIVEREGRPEGVGLGKGELTQVTSGRVMPFRGARPALRLVAGTGTLLLSFDSTEDRDRAAGELIGEAGLLIRGSVAGGAG